MFKPNTYNDKKIKKHNLIIIVSIVFTTSLFLYHTNMHTHTLFNVI